MHTDTQATEILPAAKRLKRNMVRRAPAWLIAGFLLLCACAGASWFAYQVFLVPQTTSFEPDWHDAQWIRAADGRTPVTSFRYVVNQLAVPDAAFITIAANQQFRAYVNGTFIGTNTAETIQGKVPQAYIYDVLSELVPGPNVIAIRVSNLDSQVPTLRASLGIVHGANVEHFGTGSKWQATTQGLKTNHRYETAVPPWTSYGFDASDWQPCKAAPAPSFTPLLTINQKLYERPLPLRWMSAGAGHDAYFVRHFNLPGGTTRTWMRLIATGPANIFINGRLLIVWNGQVPIVQQQPVDYLDDTNVLLPDQDAVNEYRGGLGLGIYDISPYLKAGTNTVAVHVTAPGSSNALVGLGTLNAALTLDMLVSDTNHQSFWVASDSANTDWRAARQDRPDWIYGDQATMQAWKAPFAIGRPGTSKMVYLPDSVSTSNTNVVPLSWIAQTIFLSCAAVLGLWLLMGRLIVWWSGAKTLEAKRKVLLASTLAFLPALAGEVLLVVLDHENLIAQPFPYSWPWALLLLALVAAGYALLGLVARHWPLAWQNLIPARLRRGSRRASSNGGRVLRGKRARILGWLRLNWGLVLIMLVALPMISYQLTYEPYWQDELTSYYAAKGILAHGLPFMPSGFLYPKGELYSYVLALCIAIFGEQHGLMRLPSVVAYLVSLPVFYYIAGKFFDRRVALLATAMLAFSPFTLLWGRSMRMYEQSQLLTIVVMYLFYRAIREPQRPRLIYLAMLALIATYLSHEESFIILPGLVLCALILSYDRVRRLPLVLLQKHWWIAAGLGAGVIMMQLVVVHFTHPAPLGTDQSQQPFLQIGTGNLAYYFKLLFFSPYLNRKLPMITLNSLLALLGCALAFYRGDQRARYCALFALTAFLTLMLAFTMTADRYIYPLFPVYYLLGAYVLLYWLRALWRFGCQQLALGKTYRPAQHPLRILFACSTVLCCVSLLVLPALPLSGYNLFVSRMTGLTYRHRYVDYDNAGTYIQQHWRPGDIVISIAPAIITRYYAGHLDYFFSVDRALYLFEKDGRITDTPTGTAPLLNQGDFRAVASRHARIWVVTDKGLYQSTVQQGKRFVFPPGFRIVYNGYGASVYLRDA